MDFETIYHSVRGIVHKARKEYYIKLWDQSDWDQEGMLILHQLLSQHPDLIHTPTKLYVYYKVKFRNYIKDVIRKQESQKRKFDRMAHEEISELAHLVHHPGLLSDELLALRSLLRDYRRQLPLAQQEQYDLLMSGQCFKGRQAMIRDLRIHLKDFKG